MVKTIDSPGLVRTMKTTDTQTATTTSKASTTPATTPFFTKDSTPADHVSGSNDAFFQKAPAPTPKPAATLSPEVIAIRAQAKTDAAKIKYILTDNTILTSGDQGGIMAIVWQWTIKPPQITGTSLSPFDYLVVALQQNTFTIGTLTTQWTNVFDQMMHRMNDDNVKQFNLYMKYFGKMFNDEKAHEEVKFEIKKEHIVQGLETVKDVAEAGAELAAAGLTGGASELAILASWLTGTLPKLFDSAKTIIDVVDTIRNLKKDDLKKLFSADGMGNILVKSLFGELPGLPVPQGEEEKEEKEAEGDKGAKGFMKLLGALKRVITSLLSAYKKLAGFINTTLKKIDLTQKDWFDGFSMAYAGIMTAVDAAMDPGGSISKATEGLRQITSGFFEEVKGKLDEVVGGIKDRLTVITKPAVLLKTIADKAVEWVLNFIISNPPSKLFKLLAKLVTSISGKSIVELLREKVSFADDIIKKIAESERVQKLISRLNAPIHGITSIVDSIAGKAGSFIGNMEVRTLAFMGNGEAFIKEMTGVRGRPASSEGPKEEASPTDTIGAIKSGIHSRLMERGNRLLIEKGKQLGKAAIEKGKTAVVDWWRKKFKFTSLDKQDHTLFFSGDKDTKLMVATTPIPVETVLSQISGRSEITDPTSREHKAYTAAIQLVRDSNIMITAVQTRKTGGYDPKQIDKLNETLVDLANQMKILIPLISIAPAAAPPGAAPVGKVVFFKRKTWIIMGEKTEARKEKTGPSSLQFVVLKQFDTGEISSVLLDGFNNLFLSGHMQWVDDAEEKRKAYLGDMPKSLKESVGREVTDRMRQQGKFRDGKFLNRPPDHRWFPVKQADLGHIIDAVTWWNSNGRFFGPRSPEAKKFMNEADNYEWEEKSQNRSRGASLGQNYLPPIIK